MRGGVEQGRRASSHSTARRSRWVVGSSSSSTVGLMYSARARLIRMRQPARAARRGRRRHLVRTRTAVLAGAWPRPGTSFWGAFTLPTFMPKRSNRLETTLPCQPEHGGTYARHFGALPHCLPCRARRPRWARARAPPEKSRVARRSMTSVKPRPCRILDARASALAALTSCGRAAGSCGSPRAGIPSRSPHWLWTQRHQSACAAA